MQHAATKALSPGPLDNCLVETKGHPLSPFRTHTDLCYGLQALVVAQVPHFDGLVNRQGELRLLRCGVKRV